MRLTFLREIKARIDAQGINEATACDALQPWFTEKNYSTFARLRSLQHKASAISYNTMELPRIWWTDTENWTCMRYKGNLISFSDVCKIFEDSEENLVSTWENKVLRGLDLRVDYGKLADDLTNKDIGYLFISDPRNKCFLDRTHLIREVIDGHGAFTKFLLQ